MSNEALLWIDDLTWRITRALTHPLTCDATASTRIFRESQRGDGYEKVARFEQKTLACDARGIERAGVRLALSSCKTMLATLCASHNDKVLFLWPASGNDADDGAPLAVFVHRKPIVDFRWFEDDGLDGRSRLVFLCADEPALYSFVPGTLAPARVALERAAASFSPREIRRRFARARRRLSSWRARRNRSFNRPFARSPSFDRRAARSIEILRAPRRVSQGSANRCNTTIPTFRTSRRRVMAPARDATESTALLRAANELDVARRRRRRATIASVAVGAVAVGSDRRAIGRRVSRGRRRAVRGAVSGRRRVHRARRRRSLADGGLLRVRHRGRAVAAARGRSDRPSSAARADARAGVELTQSGWSTIYVGRARSARGRGDRVRAGERARRGRLRTGAQQAVSGDGRTRERDVPGKRPRGRGACTEIAWFRIRSSMRLVDGVRRFETTWAGCLERCPLTVKLIACTGPATGDADNVWGIEESVAKTDVWRNYKGHFTSVSSGEFNTWGLNTVTGTLAWTRNADLNQFSRDNWNTATNNPVANGRRPRHHG